MEDTYKAVSNKIETEWYPYHENEWFTHEDICRLFDWREASTRREVSRKLYHDSKEMPVPKLEKNNKAFRLIDRDVEELDWMNADISSVYKLALPYGVWDNTHFDFEESISIPPKGLVVIAGTSNEGKTAFVLNILMLNMDAYKCTYFTNELTEIGLKRRFKPFEDWCQMVNGDGKPKFRVILRYDHYQDVLDPDGLNIIDYLDVNEQGEYYKLAPYMKQIQKALRKGIAVIALQKPPNRPDAFGGANLRGAASLYLSLDKNKLEVIKAKDWVNENPNGRKYSFTIGHSGSVFSDIHGIYEGE